MQNDFIKLISCDKLCIYGSLAQEISMLVTSKNQLPITNWIYVETQTLKHKKAIRVMVLDTFGIVWLYNKTIYIVLCIIIVENQVGASGS